MQAKGKEENELEQAFNDKRAFCGESVPWCEKERHFQNRRGWREFSETVNITRITQEMIETYLQYLKSKYSQRGAGDVAQG